MVARHCDGDCGSLYCKNCALEDEIGKLQAQIKMLRDALSQMDLQICAAGDLMTKEDQQEALRLEALRDRVLKETE